MTIAGDGDFLTIDPLCSNCIGECGDLNSPQGDCNDLASVRAPVATDAIVIVTVVMFGLLDADNDGCDTDEATVVTVVDIDGIVLLTFITGAGAHDAFIEIGDVIGTFAENVCVPCPGNVGMIFPVAKMFCCSINNRCSA